MGVVTDMYHERIFLYGVFAFVRKDKSMLGCCLKFNFHYNKGCLCTVRVNWCCSVFSKKILGVKGDTLKRRLAFVRVEAVLVTLQL